MNSIREVKLFEQILQDKYPNMDISEVYWEYRDSGEDFFKIEFFGRYGVDIHGYYYRSAYDEAYIL